MGSASADSIPKQMLAIGGQSALERSVRLFLSHPQIDELVVALPAEFVAAPPPYLRATNKPVRVVTGGARRQDSVRNAFNAVADDAELIVIHDAARPFASPDLISRTIVAAAESGAALAAMPARDTVKRSDGGRTPLVSETIPRETVYLAQTPQAFTRRVLKDALALGESGPDATDEAALAERAGHSVRLVEGEQSNIKLTTPEDLPVVDAIVRRSGSGDGSAFRVGTGYDLHRLVDGRRLVIGGVVVPFDRGPLGHSDGDVVCHSVTDAILGAAALGDIGRHFPDSDPRWKDADSIALLRHAVAFVHAAGFVVGNVDVTIVLERPKIKGHVDEMRQRVADALSVSIDAVSIKGKTNESVDATGAGDAIAAHAVALICRA
ncbi:MAG: 2-C-methyl-D-erythritol 4-phosphate cytidylyltransferase [Vicinamibacterales bacterium]